MSKIKPHREWTFYDHVYRCPFYLAVNGTKERAYKKFCVLVEKEPDEAQWKGKSDGTTWTINKSVGIWIRRWGNYADDYGILAHECIHAANYVLNVSGLDPAHTDNDEAYAYYMDWLMRECVWRIAKLKSFIVKVK